MSNGGIFADATDNKGYTDTCMKFKYNYTDFFVENGFLDFPFDKKEKYFIIYPDLSYLVDGKLYYVDGSYYKGELIE